MVGRLNGEVDQGVSMAVGTTPFVGKVSPKKCVYGEYSMGVAKGKEPVRSSTSGMQTRWCVVPVHTLSCSSQIALRFPNGRLGTIMCTG